MPIEVNTGIAVAIEPSDNRDVDDDFEPAAAVPAPCSVQRLKVNPLGNPHPIQRLSGTPSPTGASMRRGFTLVEIVVALAILGVSFATLVTILSASRERVMRAERRWGRQHNLGNAVEFYLLCGPDASPPRDLLPPGFSSTCRIEELDDLPEHAQDPLDGYLPARYVVGVSNAAGESLGELRVLTIVPETELQ